MDTIKHLIKLIRPINAVIVIAALTVVRIILSEAFVQMGLSPQVSDFDYFLLMLVGMFILGGGNVINDILDMEIDHINKPDKSLIPEHVSLRTAWKVYFVLNGFVLIVSAWLAWRYDLLYYFFIPLATIGLLAVYSRWLKKSYFFGNFTIAFLCACLPVVGFVVEPANIALIKANNPLLYTDILYKVLCMIVFSFILVLNRELVKDCQDIMGDRAAGARTIPLVSGEKFSKKLMHFYFIAFVASFVIINTLRLNLNPDPVMATAMWISVAIVVGSYLYTIRRYSGEALYPVMSALIKFYMVLGLIFMLF